MARNRLRMAVGASWARPTGISRFAKKFVGFDPRGLGLKARSPRTALDGWRRDRTLVMVMVNGIGAHLSNDEEGTQLIDLKGEHLIDQVCVQEIILPEKR
jgi:hypothetical protein